MMTMMTTLTRAVGEENIAGLQLAEVQLMLILDRMLHAAQMDWDVRSVGHQASVGTEDGAAEIQALLDVQTDTGLLKSASHLLCNAHEPVAEDGQLDRVNDIKSRFGCFSEAADPDDNPGWQNDSARAWKNQNSLRLIQDHCRALEMIMMLVSQKKLWKSVNSSSS